jgi:alkaline phosphatase
MPCGTRVIHGQSIVNPRSTPQQWRNSSRTIEKQRKTTTNNKKQRQTMKNNWKQHSNNEKQRHNLTRTGFEGLCEAKDGAGDYSRPRT